MGMHVPGGWVEACSSRVLEASHSQAHVRCTSKIADVEKHAPRSVDRLQGIHCCYGVRAKIHLRKSTSRLGELSSADAITWYSYAHRYPDRYSRFGGSQGPAGKAFGMLLMYGWIIWELGDAHIWGGWVEGLLVPKCRKYRTVRHMEDVKPRMQMAKTPLSRTSPVGHPLLLRCNTEGSVYRESKLC